MKKMMGDTRGISVIVGAMMLTLIVVTAATSYAIFVDDQQKKIQAAEIISLQRELENIRILTITPEYDTNQDNLSNVSFRIINMNAQETVVTSMNINNNYIRGFNITRQDLSKENFTLPFTETGKRFIIQPREQINLTVNQTNGDIVKPSNKNITINDAITLQVFTSLTNIFSKTFFPPVPLIQLDMYATPEICDGTKSYCITENAFIMNWTWTINAIVEGNSPKITYDFTSGNTYTITLDVTDNFGMKATDSYTFTI